MAIITTAATTPPTMGPVFELLLREDAEDEEVGEFGGDVVEAGKPVAGGAWVVLPARAEEEELEASINSPGPISGLSGERRCEDGREKRMERIVLTTGGHRFIRIPTIPRLACNVSSRREI